MIYKSLPGEQIILILDQLNKKATKNQFRTYFRFFGREIEDLIIPVD